jgi:hypothetical protein
MDKAINMPPNMSWAVSARLSEKGLSVMMMNAAKTNSPLPIWDI